MEEKVYKKPYLSIISPLLMLTGFFLGWLYSVKTYVPGDRFARDFGPAIGAQMIFIAGTLISFIFAFLAFIRGERKIYPLLSFSFLCLFWFFLFLLSKYA